MNSFMQAAQKQSHSNNTIASHQLYNNNFQGQNQFQNTFYQDPSQQQFNQSSSQINQQSMLMDKPEEQYLFQKTNSIMGGGQQTDYSALDTNLKLIQNMLHQPVNQKHQQSMQQQNNSQMNNRQPQAQPSQNFQNHSQEFENNNQQPPLNQYPCDYIFQQEEPPMFGSHEGSVQSSINGLSQYLNTKSQNNQNQQQPQATFQPQINPLSDRIVNSLENRVGKVQDRLYDQHKKQQAKNNHLQQQKIKQAKENANPKISQKSKQLIQHKQAAGVEPIEQRLIGFQKRIEGKKQQLEDKYKENCTFKPQINESSKLRSGYVNRPRDLLYQPLKKQSLQVNNDPDGSNFKPNINKKTIEIVERKFEGVNVYDRLTQSVDRFAEYQIPSDQQHTFVPQINPISDELDNRMKMGLQNDSIGYGVHKERWQTLYELGLKKKEDMDILRKNYQDMKEQEETSCTFKPQIYSKGTVYDTSNRVGGDSCSNRISIFDRCKVWADNKMKKIEMIKELQVDKDIDECTFKPNIKATEMNNHKERRRQISVDSRKNQDNNEHSQNSQSNHHRDAQEDYQVQNQNNNSQNIPLTQSSVFSPKTTDAIVNSKSVERFVSRLKTVRNLKQEQQEQDKKAIGSGNLWQNKITIPQEPKLNQRQNEAASRRTRDNSVNDGYQTARQNIAARGSLKQIQSNNLSQLIDQFGVKTTKHQDSKNYQSFNSNSQSRVGDQSQNGNSSVISNKFKRPTVTEGFQNNQSDQNLNENLQICNQQKLKNQPVKFEANMEFDSCLSLLHKHIQSLDI
eukprot:403348130